MLIAVVSDTHRHTSEFHYIYKKIRNADVLIHLGDNISDVQLISENFKGKIINVRGNCDFLNTLPSEKFETIENKKIFITHGNNYDVRYGITRLQSRIEALGVNLVLFGHTHKAIILYENGIWFVNPGSACEARDSFNSIALIDIKDGKIIPSIVRVN